MNIIKILVDNKYVDMELSCIYEINDTKFVIYNDFNRKNYYLAKYDKDGNLDTNLSNDEVEACSVIYEEVKKQCNSN